MENRYIWIKNCHGNRLHVWLLFFFAPTEALYANWTKTVTPNQNLQQTNEQKNHANYAFEVPWKCDNITLQKFVLRLSTQLHDADAAISFVVVQKISAASCFSGSQRQTEAWETSLSILCLHPMPAAFFCHKCILLMWKDQSINLETLWHSITVNSSLWFVIK